MPGRRRRRHSDEFTREVVDACRRPEKLDVVPAEFFVHRHIRGKWACKCCQCLAQEPVPPQVIDKGMPAAGLVAHTLVSRFVDHIPYYRQEETCATATCPVDNNHLENLMRPWAMGRKAWLFCGGELAGKRAAAVMSLVMLRR